MKAPFIYTLPKLDHSPRHCWPLIDGRYRLDGSFDKYCPNPFDHPLKAGQSESLRWIRNFGELAPGIVTEFPDGWLKLGKIQVDWDNSKELYCENYGDKLHFFLDTENGVAIPTILDPDLVWPANEALETLRSFQKEFTYVLER